MGVVWRCSKAQGIGGYPLVRTSGDLQVAIAGDPH